MAAKDHKHEDRSPLKAPVSYSRCLALPRRSTRGPLDDDDDTSFPQTEAFPHLSTEHAKAGADEQSDITPEERSKYTDAASSSPTPRVSIAEKAPQDFTFLLRNDLYHELNDTDVPQAFRITPQDHSIGDSLADILRSGFFRVAAQNAAKQLRSSTDPADHASIFSLLYIRLACLSILDYHFEAGQEAKALQDLNGSFYRDSKSGVHLAPWELRLLVVRLQAIGLGDWRRGVISYYDMARESRWHYVRSQDSAEKALWKRRLADLGVQVAHALVEMGDLDGAARHLQSLLTKDGSGCDSALQMRLALLCLRIGNISAAGHWLSELSCNTSQSDTSNSEIIQALSAMSEGSFDRASDLWRNLLDKVGDERGVRTMLEQNRAVCLVYMGRSSEAREVLDALSEEPNPPHGITFNLATLFELTSENARSLKLALAQKAATDKPSALGWERFNADFKL